MFGKGIKFECFQTEFLMSSLKIANQNPTRKHLDCNNFATFFQLFYTFQTRSTVPNLSQKLKSLGSTIENSNQKRLEKLQKIFTSRVKNAIDYLISLLAFRFPIKSQSVRKAKSGTVPQKIFTDVQFIKSLWKISLLLMSIFYHVSECGKDREWSNILDLQAEIPLFSFFQFSSLRSERSNCQKSNRIFQSSASFNIFQSNFTLPKLSERFIVPQICQWKFVLTAGLNSKEKIRYIDFVKLQKLISTCTFLYFFSIESQSWQCLKWYCFLDCYTEFLNISNIEH